VKVCKDCRRTLPLELFRGRASPRRGYEARCRSCENDLKRMRVARAREERQQQERERADAYRDSLRFYVVTTSGYGIPSNRKLGYEATVLDRLDAHRAIATFSVTEEYGDLARVERRARALAYLLNADA